MSKVKGVAIAGLGSAGKRMLDLLEGRGVEGIYCYDPCLKSGRTWLDCLKHSEAAIICSPPSAHHDQVRACLERHIPVLVEKPLSALSWHAKELIPIQKKTKTPAYVGYNLRFHEPLAHMIERARKTTYHADIIFGYNLNYWRPGQSIREGYAPWKAKGGGILLDASHEIDTVIQLYGKPKEVAAILTPFRKIFGFGDTEGTATLLLMFAKGQTATIHLNYMAWFYTRSVTVLPGGGGDGNMNWGCLDPTMLQHTYGDELDEFLRCIETGEPSKKLATLQDGLTVLEVIDAAKRTVKSGRTQTLSPRGQHRSGHDVA